MRTSAPASSILASSVLLLFAGGCGPTSTSTEPAPETTGGTVATPRIETAHQADEVDPQICATDADCMVGTPRDCCTSFCPADRIAWSRAAWADYQAECAVEECTSTESIACLEEVVAPMVAACHAARCVLVPG